VRAGQALSDALEARGVFSRFFVSMVRAAEAAGTLDSGLARLAEHEERNKALRDTVVSALVYPCVVLGVAGVSLLIILAYVVPQFTQLFADAGRAALRDYWWLLLALAAGAAIIVRLQLATSAGRYRWNALVLRLPLAGELVRRMEMARLSRSLATLMASGVSLVRGVSIAGDIISNRVLAEALDLAADGLKAGRGLAAPLLATGVFPVLGLQMMKVGEETGHLEQMLERVAELYDREVASATQRMLALLEPLLIVGLGLVIAGIILSLMAAIVSINDLPL
jgi:general secretion pathway protein F